MNIEESAFKDRKTLANLNAIDLLDIIEFLQLDRKQWINQFSKTHNESIDIQKENQELKQKYENAVADYETTMAENKELKQINEEHKKLNGDLRKENQEIRLDQTKKVFHVLTHVLLNGGCTYRYLISDLLGFKLEIYSDLIEGMNIVNAIATLEELKEQVENKEDFINKLQATKDKLDKWDYENTMKQKEFINFLEDNYKKTQDIWYIKILQKYREIIGDINDKK